MPLPDGGRWPPEPTRPVFDRLAVWSAWYAGDPEQLSAVYGGDVGFGLVGTVIEQRDHRLLAGVRSRVRNLLQRWFWGTPTPAREQRTKLHVPIAADIAATSADLLFSEPPALTVEDTGTQDRLAELAETGLYASLLEAGEIAAALGGVYLRVCWDREVADYPWIDPVHADAAVPEWRWGRLVAVTFWRVLDDDGAVVVRHLERHEPGAIRHGLYTGDRGTLGRRIPLTEHPHTAALADTLTDGDAIGTGVPDRLTAVYVPNMRPNRLWRDTPGGAYLGRSDYAGAEPLLDAIDETYSSWMRDVRLAKGRLVVPNSYLEVLGPGRGARFDPEQEIYAGVNALTGPEQPAPTITPVQFAIRVAEHQATAADLLAQVLRHAGYATQTFGLTGDVALTATEVTARERRSFVTRNRKLTYWRPALAEICQTLLAVDSAIFGTRLAPERPVVSFGDSVSEDPRHLAETVELLHRAEAASTETRVRLVHPDWDENQVRDEVAAINTATAFDPDELLRHAAATGELPDESALDER